MSHQQPQLSPAALAAAQAKQDEERNVCLRATALVHGARAAEYGPVHESFVRIARYWSNLFGHHVSAEQVSLAMMLFKVARESHQHKDDNLVDICGYAECSSLLHKYYGESQDSFEAAMVAPLRAAASDVSGSSHKAAKPKSKRRR